MEQKKLIPYFVALAIIILGAVLFSVRGKGSNQVASNINTQVPQKATDERDCISDEQGIKTEKSFFVNKWFVSMATSGRWGQLKEDGSLPEEWGLDSAGPNDTRPSSGVGSWEYNNGVVTLKNPDGNNEEGNLSGFRYFLFKDNIFAVPKEYSGVIFGPDKDSISAFFESQINPLWKDSKGCYE